MQYSLKSDVIKTEESFKRLCRLIKHAPDNDETAVEINELMNRLYTRYSELTIFRAVAKSVKPWPVHTIGKSVAARQAREQMDQERKVAVLKSTQRR